MLSEASDDSDQSAAKPNHPVVKLVEDYFFSEWRPKTRKKK